MIVSTANAEVEVVPTLVTVNVSDHRAARTNEEEMA